MKFNTRIEVSGFDANLNPVWRPARIARTTACMKPLPDGYRPVKFEDGGILLVHETGFRVTDNR